MKLLPVLSPLRRRGCLLIFSAVVLIPFTIVVLLLGPGNDAATAAALPAATSQKFNICLFRFADLTAEQTLSQKLAEFQMRVQYLESMYRAKQEDVSILLGLAAAANNGSSGNASGGTENNSVNSFNSVLEALSPESKAIIKNLTLLQSQQRFASAGLRLPTAYHFLPHLLDDPSSLRPAYLLSKGKTGVSIVLGIPTVKRDKQSYLLGTLDNLIVNMDEEEQNDTSKSLLVIINCI